MIKGEVLVCLCVGVCALACTYIGKRDQVWMHAQLKC